MESQSETTERLDNCPSTSEDENVESKTIEEARLLQLSKNRGNCVICLTSIKNGLKRCFPENCSHIFHFDCLQRWSQQKNTCPLCKQVFNQIIHNIKSTTEFDRHPVTVQRQEESHSPIDIDLRDLVPFQVVPINVPLNSVFHRVNFVTNHSPPLRRFTYRTRFEATLEQNERIQEFFGTRIDNNYSRLTPHEWRRYIYDRNLYALPLPESHTGRYRECSAAFYRENPAQTHRLIPWLNRELVVLMTQTQANLIPQILEEMREMLCQYDIQSRHIRKYFQRYLHLRTDHFIHEFYNFCISPYDIVGYDRYVDYSARLMASSSTTVELLTSESSDDEVLVVSPEPEAVNENASNITNPTTVVLETSGNVEENCVIADISQEQPVEMELNVDPVAAVVLESSSDSECEFVLALKPPHLRTPEMLSLDSASDSDVIFIPNEPNVVTRVDSSTTDSEDNKPLAETRKQLKSEIDEEKPDIKAKPIMQSIGIFNFAASTSNSNGNDDNGKVRKIYFAPKRKRLAMKSVFENLTSSSSESSSPIDEETEKNSNKSKSRKKLTAKKLKRMRLTSAIVNNPKPLSQLQSSEQAHNIDGQPRVKSVIIKKTDNSHYIQKPVESSSDSTSSND